MPLVLTGSVGAGGENSEEDVLAVQYLLNCVPAAIGGPEPRLSEDGLVGQKTIAAIKKFQETAGLPIDGRIDPGHTTLDRLNDFRIEVVTVWINAFIPGTIEGLTKAVPNTPDRTMIEGPFRSLGSDDCFFTDNRDFSDDPEATSRMHSQASIDFTTFKPTLFGLRYRCSPTIECSCTDGQVKCNKMGATDRMKFSLNAESADHVAIFSVSAASHNPCINVPAVADAVVPDIDYTGAFTIDTSRRRLEFKGYVDVFPAFEAYARINSGPPMKLFAISRKPNATPWALFADPTLPAGGNRLVHIVLTDADGDGVFEDREVIAEPQ